MIIKNMVGTGWFIQLTGIANNIHIELDNQDLSIIEQVFFSFLYKGLNLFKISSYRSVIHLHM